MSRGKVEALGRAARNLGEVRAVEPPYSVLETTGIVGLFEVAYEAAWKALKEVLTDAGYNEARSGSPKAILGLAFQAGIIDDEQRWLDAHRDRNLLIHTYDEAKVLLVIPRIRNDYLPLFESLAASLADGWE